MIPGIQVNKARMREAVMLGYPTATDFADYLSAKACPSVTLTKLSLRRASCF